MTDILDMIADLKELRKLYEMGDICLIDFQDKISKYETQFDSYERDMESQYEFDLANG